MDRRHFLLSAGATALSAAALTWSSTNRNSKQRFREALIEKPWLAAFHSVRQSEYDSSVRLPW